MCEGCQFSPVYCGKLCYTKIYGSGFNQRIKLCRLRLGVVHQLYLEVRHLPTNYYSFTS